MLGCAGRPRTAQKPNTLLYLGRRFDGLYLSKELLSLSVALIHGSDHGGPLFSPRLLSELVVLFDVLVLVLLQLLLKRREVGTSTNKQAKSDYLKEREREREQMATNARTRTHARAHNTHTHVRTHGE
jgi:hypothetical protein